MDKKELLKQLEEEIRADAALPLRDSNLVFGEGSPDCEVMFIGEAPGFHEDRLGRPFVGRGGQLLDELIASVGWKREDVYITNIVKRRPPENRDPLPEEISLYAPYLARQIEIVHPKIIVPLGRFAMNFFLPDAKISRDQGRIFIVDGKRIIPLFHPAAALRSTGVLAELRKSFGMLPDVLAGKASIEPAEVFSKKEKTRETPPQSSLF